MNQKIPGTLEFRNKTPSLIIQIDKNKKVESQN
jgi:hypothetical protein